MPIANETLDRILGNSPYALILFGISWFVVKQVWPEIQKHLEFQRGQDASFIERRNDEYKTLMTKIDERDTKLVALTDVMIKALTDNTIAINNISHVQETSINKISSAIDLLIEQNRKPFRD